MILIISTDLSIEAMIEFLLNLLGNQSEMRENQQLWNIKDKCNETVKKHKDRHTNSHIWKETKRQMDKSVPSFFIV